MVANLKILCATGVVLASETVIRLPSRLGALDFVELEQRGPVFSEVIDPGLSGASRDCVKENWPLNLYHLCEVLDEPRPTHYALAALQKFLKLQGGSLTTIVDATDNHHERAGLIDVVHSYGLKCECCGCMMHHRSDLGLFRGAACPQCHKKNALWRFEPTFWTGGLMSRGDGVSDRAKLEMAVSECDLVVVIGCGMTDRARHGLMYMADLISKPVLIFAPCDHQETSKYSIKSEYCYGDVDQNVTGWANNLQGRLSL